MKARKLLSMLLALTLLIGLLPATVGAAVADTPAGVRNHLPSTAKDIVYLSDMTFEYSCNRDNITAQKDTAPNGTSTIVLGDVVANGGTTFTKGLGVKPYDGGATAATLAHTVYDLKDNDYAQSYFYSAVGITNDQAKNSAYQSGHEKYVGNGVYFEVYGSYDKTVENYADAEFVLLEKSDKITNGIVYQFHLDVTGVRYLKLVVYGAQSAYAFMDCAWAEACVYNNPGYYPKTDMIGKCTNDGGEYVAYADRDYENLPTMFNAFECGFNTYNFPNLPSNATKIASLTPTTAKAGSGVGKNAGWLGGTHVAVSPTYSGSKTQANTSQKDGIKFAANTSIYFKSNTAANSGGAADGYAVYDVSSLNADTFYAIIGRSDHDQKYQDYDPATGNYGGLVFEVWGKGASDGDFRLLSASEVITKSHSGEFLVDITGIQQLKLRFRQQDPRAKQAYGIFGYASVFNDAMSVAVSGETSVVKGTTADYTATATRVFTEFYNYMGDITWEISGATAAGTKIEDGKLTVDPAETATELKITASITEGNRTVTSTPVTVEVKDWDTSKVAYVGQNGHETLAEAIAAAGKKPVTVMKDITLTEAVVIDEAVTLDLNGKTVSGDTVATLDEGAKLTIVAEGGKLDGQLKLAADGAEINADCDIALEMNGKTAIVNAENVTLTDTATDNGTVGGKVYGNFDVTDRVTENGAIRYLVLDGEDTKGAYKTANAVRVKLTQVSIRPSAAGIYYSADVKFNRNVAGVNAVSGVALSTKDAPGDSFLGEDDNCWTAFAAEAGADFSRVGTSCLVKNIMADGAEASVNAARGALDIYANGYVKVTVDGKDIVLMAENTNDVVFSLKTVMQNFDTKLAAELQNYANGTGELSADGQKLLAFYETWEAAMNGWGLNNVAAAYAKKNAA